MKEVLVLVGFPGAGKSTYCQRPELKDYVRVNQDEMGSKDKCVAVLSAALKDGKNVVVDRCNQDVKQRKLWIDLANYYGAIPRCVYLVVDPEVCFDRVFLRKNHPTITADLDAAKKRSIIAGFVRAFEMPTLEEGFNEVTYRRNV